jgi:hypothetical protein
VLAQEQDLPREVVKTVQAGDKFCQSLKPGPATSKSEYFTDEEGLIYRRRKNGEHQLVVPVNLANRVIKMNHDPVTVANPGRSRTLDILCLRFYWPGMRRHVDEYVKICHACQRLKPRHEFTVGGRSHLCVRAISIDPQQKSLPVNFHGPPDEVYGSRPHYFDDCRGMRTCVCHARDRKAWSICEIVVTRGEILHRHSLGKRVKF